MVARRSSTLEKYRVINDYDRIISSAPGLLTLNGDTSVCSTLARRRRRVRLLERNPDIRRLL